MKEEETDGTGLTGLPIPLLPVPHLSLARVLQGVLLPGSGLSTAVSSLQDGSGLALMSSPLIPEAEEI